MSRRLSPGRWVPTLGRRRNNTTGLVISGGGSRGDFHLGALAYLYDHARITPRVMAGTSAGAIIAAILAQGATREEQRAWLTRLDTMWRTMDSPDDMFTPQPWWRTLTERGPSYLQLLDPINRGSSHRAATAAGTTPETAAEVRAAAAAAQAEEPPGWTAGQVMQMIGNLPALGRAGGDLASILRGASQSGSMYAPGPVVDALIDTEMFDPARVRASGVTLRIAMVGLQSGELRFADQDGTLRDRGDAPLLSDDGAPVTVSDLAMAVWASCAIPAVFHPIEIAGEHYVDGGVRENLPADVVIDKLGVTDTWALVCHPPGAPASAAETGTDIVSVMMRTGTSIMSDEQLRDEVVYARQENAHVVEATVDVHDTMTVDRGLTALMADHGWIRAAQVHLGASEGDEDAGSALIRARRRAWEIEELLLDPDGERAVAAGTGLAGLMTGSRPGRPEGARPEQERPGAVGSRARRLFGREARDDAEHASPGRGTAGAGRPGGHDTDDPGAAGPRRSLGRTDLRAELRRLLRGEPGIESRTALVDELADVKNEVRDLLDVLPRGHVPPGADTWWRTWETHGEHVSSPPPWELDDNTGVGGA